MSVNKSGYEIRAQVLEMAKDFGNLVNSCDTDWYDWQDAMDRAGIFCGAIGWY